MNLGVVILAELAVGIGAGGVEVAQPDRPDAVGALEVRQRLLDRQLGLPVGVDRRGRDAFRATAVSAGSPYTAQVEENTNARHPSAAIASSVPSVPVTLLR